MPALIVYLIGPSGVGKDSLQHWLLRHWTGPGRLCIAPRTITRPTTDTDVHEALTQDAFIAARQAGAFALDWAANGFYYGIRHQALTQAAADDVVLVNGSRAYVPHALARLPYLAILSLTASHDTLYQRLRERGRETEADIAARAARTFKIELPFGVRVQHLSNEGRLADTGQAALSCLRQWQREVRA